MRDLKREHQILFQIREGNADEALRRIEVALEFLWDDNRRSIHDKVAGDFDYEELIAALLHAQAALSDARA